MIKRINKIIALVLIWTSITTIASFSTFSINAKAAINDNSEIVLDSQKNNETLGFDISSIVPSGSNLVTMAETSVINPSLEAGVNSIFKLQGVTDTSKITAIECGKLSYDLSDESITTLTEQVSAQLKAPLTAAITTQALANSNIQALISAKVITKDSLQTAIGGVVETNLKADLPLAIKTRFANIPIYQYTGKDDSETIRAQAFVIKGLVGSIVNTAVGAGSYCENTYNAKVRNATYSSTELIPSLDFNPVTGTDAYGKAIDLSNGAQVIGDGMSINVIDPSNKKVYVVNNPVYNMLKVQNKATNYISKDLNVIDFSGNTNLKGSLSTPLVVDGNSFSILSLSLNTKDSTAKNYQYALLVGDYEKSMLDNIIDGYNLTTTAGATVKELIKTGTYTMVPNLNSAALDLTNKVGNTIDSVTNSLDDLSDAVDDLSDSLKDKSDDIDDALDKVFKRFDNDKGWGKRDGYRYYYDSDGVSLKGVQKINGKTFYFNRIDGAMETGWQIVDGNRCYFDKKKGYELFNQWIQDNDDKYFVSEDGAVKKMEWVNDGGKSYYLKADGKMTKGWLKIEDYWYLFNEDGSMVTSTWKLSDNKWYYLKDNGQAANDWLQLGTKWYYFKDPSGAMQTGWFRANGSWYCANDDGSMKTGWADSKDGECYLDDTTGKMKKDEWVNVNGKSYYFNVNGIMVTGSRYIDGTKYIFNSDGSLS